MAWRMGAFLNGLPLSKLKIVIGEFFFVFTPSEQALPVTLSMGNVFELGYFQEVVSPQKFS